MSLTSFCNNVKSSNVRNKLLNGKEADFYGVYLDVTDLKIRPLIVVKVVKCMALQLQTKKISGNNHPFRENTKIVFLTLKWVSWSIFDYFF